MEVRLITPADVDACAEVLYVASDELHARLGQPPSPRNEAAFKALFEHIRSSTPKRSWLAEERGKVLGFGVAARRAEMTYLAFLFVLPDQQGRGIGRVLYESAMPATGYRAVAIEAIQPVSAALYSSYGLTPREAIYSLEGRPRGNLPTFSPKQLHIDLAQSEADQLDREVLGITRAVDHAAWRDGQRRGFALRVGEQLLGYGYAHSSGSVGPVVVRRRELLLPFLGSLIRAVPPIDAWRVHVPGRADETFSALLRAGMRLDGPPALFCAARDGIDHSRYLPVTFALP